MTTEKEDPAQVAAEAIRANREIDRLLIKYAQFAVMDERFLTQEALDDLSRTINVFLEHYGIADLLQKEIWVREIFARLDWHVADIRAKAGTGGGNA